VYHLSEYAEQTHIDNRVHTVDDLGTVLLRDDISNDVLPSIVDDQTQRSKPRKHRRTRKGARKHTTCLTSMSSSRCH
jgi:hypothetical protein